MRKLSIIVFLMFSLMLSGMAQAASIDVTAPGDTIKGYPDDGDWPAAEAPPYVIDNKANTKFLHFKGDNETSGFQVTASLGGMVVTEMTLTTGNDAPERDPVVVELYGSNDSIDGPYTLIAVVDVVDFNQPDPWPRGKKNETTISFANAVAYAHYQVLFTVLRVPENGCCMQIAEVELLATLPDLTAPWVYKDIGTASGGNAWEDAGTYNIRASGHDIWGGSDGFGYMYRPLSGNGSIEVLLTSMDVTDAWAKAAVMIRETSAANSKFAMMDMSGSNGVALAYRSETGGGCADMQTGGQEVPEILRLERDENEFIAQYGFELMAGYWVMVDQGSTIISMNSDALIGLAVCSHNNDLLCTSVFEDMTLVVPLYEKVWDMAPADGSADVPLMPTLTWLPGETAVTHDVYLGTDSAALPLVDTKDLGDESYTPGAPLMEGAVYYWQIVEQPGGNAGPVYSFTTYASPTGITREVWEGIEGVMPGDLTSNPDYPCCPTWSDKLPSMASYDFADNYGAHMQGVLWPETSGDYTFWIAADDGCELWLSSDADPANMTRIAYHNAWTGAHNWFWYGEQQSAPISLVGGQRYFIRAIWKEGGGGDNCQVAWFGPDQPVWPVDGSNSAVITNYYFPPDSLVASSPNPRDGQGYTPKELEKLGTLSWAKMRMATSQEVYFCEEGGTMALIATLPPDQTSTALPAVELDKTYNWKVNMIIGTDVVEGPVWSFSVSEWVSLDVDTTGGSSSYDEVSGVTTIIADGADVWGNSDQFHYLYHTPTLTRDIGTIIARVTRLDETNEWAKAGVMFRETREGNSKWVMMAMTPPSYNHQSTLQYRTETGGGCGDQTEPEIYVPEWVKLVRSGNLFIGYRSEDGENWIKRGEVTINMDSDALVGLAVTSHTAGVLTTAEFESISVSTPNRFQAWNPNPRDGTENVPLYTTLSWGAGDDADEHRLYISDNRDDVYYGLVDPIILPAGTTEYEAGPLDLAKPHYWAVDEVIWTGRDCEVILGDIWSFKVENYRLVEDFEPYDDPPIPIEDLPEQVVIAGDYTIPGYTIAAIEPNSACLVALYEFEGDCNDSSGNGYDGEPNGTISYETDPEMGMVLSLPGGDNQYVKLPEVGISGNDPTTIACWAKADNTSIPDWTLIFGFSTPGGDCGSHFNIGSLGGPGGVGAHAWCFESTIFTDEEALEWRHYAMTFDGTTIKYYGDGDEIGQADMDLSIRGDYVNIGKRNTATNSFPGKVDDAQIYNCALSYGEVRYMADAGDLVVPDVYVPPVYGPMIAEYLVELPDPTADTSGNGFHGTPLGDVTVVEDAVRGCVATFDGDGDAVNIGNDPMFNPGYEDFSISLWINMTSYGGNWSNVIIGKRGEGGLSWQLRRLSDTYRLSFTTRTPFADDDEDGWGTGGQDVSLNEWHHVAAVRQGTQKWLYIDGVQEAISDIGDYIEPCGNDVYVGARSNGDNTGPEAFFNGMVDNVRYYKNTALTYGQVLNLLEYEALNPIHDTWYENGAALSLDYYEQHWGDKSMKVDIGSTGKVGRIVNPPFGDWDSGNAKAMVMYFKGDPCNVIDDMYMKLVASGPTEFPYDGDINDLKSEDWTEWNIDLTGVSGVRQMALGLSGVGTVNFDDLRLYPPRCRAEFGPSADFTGDCLVDARDIRVMAGDWLMYDETSTRLMARFEFEGNLEDSSGNGNHATAHGTGIGFETDPCMGMVLSLPGGDSNYVSVPPVGISGNDQSTIACWAKADHTSIPDWTLVFGFSTPGGDCGSHFNIGSIGGPGGVGAHIWCWESTIFTDDEALEWRHYAMTFDGTTIKSYGDGLQVDQIDYDLWRRGDYINIGKRNTQESSFPGKIDDARVYKRALTEAEVVTVMGGGEVDPVYWPILSQTNIYDGEPENSRFVNFKDYAALMEEWLYQQLWP